MAIEDKQRWNEKYKNTPELFKNRKECETLIKILQYKKEGKVLEIACGTGRNSIFLAKNGFSVDAFDISSIAISYLKEQKIKNLNAKELDLEEYIPSENTYDLIVMTNYLDRNIIPHLKNALKKDGILFIETYMEDKINEKIPSNKQYLLKKDELKNFFDEDFLILDYREFENEKNELYKMMKQSIIVEKI